MIKILCNILLDAPKNNAKETFLFSAVLILLGKIVQVKTLCNAVQKGLDNIAQAKI